MTHDEAFEEFVRVEAETADHVLILAPRCWWNDIACGIRASFIACYGTDAIVDTRDPDQWRVVGADADGRVLRVYLRVSEDVREVRASDSACHSRPEAERTRTEGTRGESP